MKKGFTLIEIIISISIIIILTAIVVNSMTDAKTKKQMEGIADNIVTKLEEARANSVTGKNGEKHGVKFNSDSFINFQGDAYDSADTENKETRIDSKFEIVNTLTTPNETVIFNRISGDTGINATVTVRVASSPDNKMDIVIEELGNISVIK